MAQTNSEQTQQTPQTDQQVTQQSEQQVQDNTQQQPVAEQQPVQQPVEEPAQEKPKVITYLGNEYELDNYIKQLQYNIGPYISYLKLDRDQSRILRDSFNMFIGKLRAGEVAIDDTGAWVDYAGEMANTKKGFDPWGLVVRLANMGLSNMTPYQAPPEPEKTPALPEFTLNSKRGYLFSNEDPLANSVFPDLTWDEQKEILKEFFNFDSSDPNKYGNYTIYTQWREHYNSAFQAQLIQKINEELNKENTTEPSGKLKYYLSQLGYNTNSIWPKSTTETDSQTSPQTNTGSASVNESNSQSTTTTSTQGNTSQSSSTLSTFDQWVAYNTSGVDYNNPILELIPINQKQQLIINNNAVKGDDQRRNFIGQFANLIYNIGTLSRSQILNFMDKFFSNSAAVKQHLLNVNDQQKRAWIVSNVLNAIKAKYPDQYITKSGKITYLNLLGDDAYYLLGIQNNKLKRFKWDSTEWGQEIINALYNNSVSKKKKGGTIVKAQVGLHLQNILSKSLLETPFDTTKYTSLLNNPSNITLNIPTDVPTSLLNNPTDVSIPSATDNLGIPSFGDRVTQAQPQGSRTITTPDIDPDQIRYTGSWDTISNIAERWDPTTDWSQWRNSQINNKYAIIYATDKDGQEGYFSVPLTMAYLLKDNLKNYYFGTQVVPNEDLTPGEGNAKWMSSLLSSLNALNKGLFTSLNNDANARLLKENTLPVLQTPQTYTYSPLTTNYSTQQLQRQQALDAERQQQLGADQQSDITLGLNARKSATLDRLNNEQAILASTDSQLRTDMASNISDQNKYFQNLSELTNTNRKSIYDAQLQRAQIDAANRTKNTENVWDGVFDTVGNNLQSIFTDQIERDEAIMQDYWRQRGNEYMNQAFQQWKRIPENANRNYNDFLNTNDYQLAQTEVSRMLRLKNAYTPSALAYNWVTPKNNTSGSISGGKKGGRLTYSILNKLRR